MADDSGGITSPEGVLMLCIAAIFDAAGIILTIVTFFVVTAPITVVLGIILDALGIAVFGIWLLIRGSGTQKVKEQTEETVKKIKKATEKEAQVVEKTAAKTAAKRGGARLLVVIGSEFLPIINALPMWTWFVYKEMGGMGVSSSKDQEESENKEGGTDSSGEVVPADIVDNKNEQKQTGKTPSKTNGSLAA